MRRRSDMVERLDPAMHSEGLRAGHPWAEDTRRKDGTRPSLDQSHGAWAARLRSGDGWREDRTASESIRAWLHSAVHTISSLFASSKAWPRPTEAVAALLVGVAYYLGAELAFQVGTLSHMFAPLWPPNVILLCALVRARYCTWWIYVGIALPAHIVAEAQMGMPAEEYLGAFICNSALAIGAALGLRFTIRQPPWMATLAKARTTILIIAVIAPAVVALAIVGLAVLTGEGIGSVGFAKRWFLANLLNGLTLAPMLLTWIGGGYGGQHSSPGRWAEAAFVTAGIVIGAYFGFAVDEESWRLPTYACLLVPLVLWASVRFGTRGASGAVCIVTLMAIVGAMREHGPFIGRTPEDVVFSLQIFLTAASAPFIILAAVIEERQKVSADARSAEHKLQLIVDNTPASICAWEPAGQWDYASRRFFEFTGLSSDAVGRPLWSELVHPEDLVRINAAWHRSATRGEPFEQELRLRAADSRYYWFLVRGHPIRDASGEIERWFGAALEIEQLKHTESMLYRTNARLTGILASISDFYYTLDDKLCVTEINPRACEFLGVQPAQVLGRNILDAFPQIIGSELEKAYSKALRDRATVHLECSAIVRPNRWLDVSIYPFDTGLSVFSRDATDRKRAERDLQELSVRLLCAQDEERRRIARELHDGTAQNMAAIKLNFERLFEPLTNVGQDLAHESLALIDECLSDIRTLSYLLHPPLLDEVGLPAALRWYIDGFERRSSIRIDLRISPGFQRLRSNAETALFRVVQECLVNVHRHARSETAAIQLDQTSAEVALTITDKGKGMPVQAYAASGDTLHLLGVGIAGMSARLKQLGGRLEITSSKQGTMVRAVVPSNSVGSHYEHQPAGT